jgi:hypothetical protein
MQQWSDLLPTADSLLNLVAALAGLTAAIINRRRSRPRRPDGAWSTWCGGPQPGQDGQDAPVVVRRRLQMQFGQQGRDVALDGLLGESQVPGDGGVGTAFGHVREDLAFPGGEPVEQVGVPAPGEQPYDDVGVHHGFAAYHSFQGAGGGTWTVPLDPATAARAAVQPAAVVTLEVAELCRLAADRRDPGRSPSRSGATLPWRESSSPRCPPWPRSREPQAGAGRPARKSKM